MPETATLEPEVNDEAEAQAATDETPEAPVEAGEDTEAREPEPETEAVDDTPPVVATVEKYVQRAIDAAMDQDDEREDAIPAQQIRVANYAECQSILDDAHKQMKKQHEAAVEELRAMRSRARADAAAKNRPLPLIDQAEHQQTDDESWKAEPIDVLLQHGARSTDVEKLKEAEVDTLGKFQAVCAKHGTYWHRDIKGVGEGAAERIQDASNAFHLARQAPAGPDEGEPSAPQAVLNE